MLVEARFLLRMARFFCALPHPALWVYAALTNGRALDQGWTEAAELTGRGEIELGRSL